MRHLFNVTFGPKHRPKTFVRGVTRAIANKLKQDILIGFQNAVGFNTRPRIVSLMTIGGTVRRKTPPRHYNVYRSHLSMPFARGLTRSEAGKVKAGLRRVFRTRAFVRYWKPGTDGRFMKPC